ncbi:MAG: acylphosphatase [Candidatus Magnetoglobus multicellularis str. Araruama]|uniref:acylphosphatase n=1 Tax=Candidatus Magnetoglobus multicellularis str. Araruama TaxID=890399 RepID=A0A1V1NWW4_9BACT|nr:MAG: acylphosphatase [Candidatus Magnetoglobus multicellularis str. Araruama]
MSQKVRCHVRISGKVQGVGYRMETRRTAEKLGVKGWVKNRSDGTVEAVFEGSQDAVDQLIEWCYSGPPNANVTDIAKNWDEPIDNCQSFNSVY